MDTTKKTKTLNWFWIHSILLCQPTPAFPLSQRALLLCWVICWIYTQAHTSCCDHDAQWAAPSDDLMVSCVSIGTHTLEKGVVTMGMVRNIIPKKGLILNLPFGNCGLACITDLTDEYVDCPFEQYKEGQVVRYEHPCLRIKTVSHNRDWPKCCTTRFV